MFSIQYFVVRSHRSTAFKSFTCEFFTHPPTLHTAYSSPHTLRRHATPYHTFVFTTPHYPSHHCTLTHTPVNTPRVSTRATQEHYRTASHSLILVPPISPRCLSLFTVCVHAFTNPPSDFSFLFSFSIVFTRRHRISSLDCCCQHP